MYATALDVVSAVFVLSGFFAALIVWLDLRRHPQAMKIMNSVWVLTALWGGFLALWVYYRIGRGPRCARTGTRVPMNAMPREAAAGMPGMGMPLPGAGEMPGMAGPVSGAAEGTHDKTDASAASGMPMQHTGNGMHRMIASQADRPRAQVPGWRPTLLSSLHCGAGCTLADLLGEWFVFFVPVAIGGSLLAGSWVLDYLLALLIGVGFQYAAIQGMGRLPRKTAIRKALKADFLSLTAWQTGMYGWMAIVIFCFFGGTAPRHDSWTFWFMMQLAMLAGLLVAYPVNRWLIRRGIKKAM